MNLSDTVTGYQQWLLSLNKQLLDHLANSSITQQKFQEDFGISDSSWYRRMEDPTYWTSEEIERICALTNVSLDSHLKYISTRNQLEKLIRGTGIKLQVFASKVGLNYERLRRRFQDPEKFTINEVMQIVSFIEKYTQ